MSNGTNENNRFRFGENWSSFALKVNDANIQSAVKDLSRLISNEEIKGQSFIDVGSGSGLSSLAAKKLGCGRLLSIDIDLDCVETTKCILKKYVLTDDWQCQQMSIFDVAQQDVGVFDVVYSWGVLHHTGRMYEALDACIKLVKPGGKLIIAIYQKTLMCKFWKVEKRFYSQGPSCYQKIVRGLYKIIYILGLLTIRRNPINYIRNFQSKRGMDWHHDIHDWLGGFPYESEDPVELKSYLEKKGFFLSREFVKATRFKGLLGSHCNEFVFKRGVS